MAGKRESAGAAVLPPARLSQAEERRQVTLILVNNTARLLAQSIRARG